ncbi:MAG: hypothetical protein FWG63_10290 [Defluviitaleaceae bacterium]|nr:hypothetical protein [Defluviitaleaceae bacterium]
MRWLVLSTFLFYSLNVTGFKIKDFILVESCLKNEPIDMVFWVPYLVSVIVFWIWPGMGQWFMLGFMSLGTLVLFMTTVKHMIWPSKKKIKGYNEFFSKTHHIIKPSDTKLIPDTFHLILLFLVPLNLTGIVVYILR